MKYALPPVLIALCALMLGSCGGTEAGNEIVDGGFDAGDGGVDGAGDSGGDAAQFWPDPPECVPPLVPVGRGCEALKLPAIGPEWQKIEPGGETSCARGAPFHFYVRGGTSNRLLVSFRGGGACWDNATCALNDSDAFFVDEIEERHNPARENGGIFDLDNAANPFAGWYMVHVPYCTGDLHWGGADFTYPAENGQPEITVRHRGFINAGAAIDWIAANFNAPGRLFITGGSAGSYGSELHSARLMTLFPYSAAVNLGDGGSGVFTREFYLQSFPRWGFPEHVPNLPGFTDRNYSRTDYGEYRIAMARHFTGRTFAHATTVADETQQGYYFLAGGEPGVWSSDMLALVARVAGGAENYRFFLMPGNRHVTIYDGEFYTEEGGGVRFRDWVADLAEGRPVESVRCVECR
jgi:hypothetical protein